MSIFRLTAQRQRIGIEDGIRRRVKRGDGGPNAIAQLPISMEESRLEHSTQSHSHRGEELLAVFREVRTVGQDQTWHA